MVAESKQTHIAYRCPHCGNAILGYVGNFALSADMLKIKCQCGKSEMTLTYTQDKKIRLQVPCLFCQTPHHFVVSQKLFFEKDIFMLSCPYAGMDICFIGHPEKLQTELDRTSKELNELYDRMGLSLPIEDEKKKQEEEEIISPSAPDDYAPDEEIFGIVRYVIRELEAEGGIDCPCHCGEYEIEATPEGIRVFCPECGADYIFAATSLTAAQDFLNTDSLILKPHDGQKPKLC